MQRPIVVLGILATLNFACRDSGNPVLPESLVEQIPIDPPGDPGLVPGLVSFGFSDTVKLPFVETFLANLGLTVLNLHADSAFTMWIQVDSGKVDEKISALLLDSTVAWAEQRGYDGGDPEKEYIIVRFNGTSSIENALGLIASLPGVSWKKTIASPWWVVVAVEIGTERQWINTLKAYTFLIWVEVIPVIRVDD